MGAKFGLEFRVVDTAYVKDLRRTQGLYANPWTSFPRLDHLDRLAETAPPAATPARRSAARRDAELPPDVRHADRG